MTNKLLPVALIAALVGGSVGALVMHSRNQSNAAAAETVAQDNGRYLADRQQAGNEQYVPAEFNTSAEQTAYKEGFTDGFKAAQGGATGLSSNAAPTGVVYQPNRVVTRTAARNYSSTSGSRTLYTQPRSRSFWQKHRDKLTVAMGTGGGAALGALVGGKKGAAIGGLAGGGGSALYTYKIRNRNRRY
ncbi:MAG: hypothetical protein ABJB97_02700 [Acidobacteriota bacterium]